MTYGQTCAAIVLTSIGLLVFVACTGGTILLIKIIYKSMVGGGNQDRL